MISYPLRNGNGSPSGHYAVYNLDARTDTLIGTYSSLSDAEAVRVLWSEAWPKDRFAIKTSARLSA